MSIAHHINAEPSNIITPAKVDWQMDDTGNMVPVSGEFGDVYFSHADGLAETRHVFLEHNQLPDRLARLAPQQCFTIAELGFGTGLNLLA
ncbi:FAD-dependent cmnm(5)s(2)U34 oxidoreductase, partial [Psychrobacter sp. 1Y4]